MTLGQTLRAARLRAGLLPIDLASAAGVARQTISAIEVNWSPGSYETAGKLAMALADYGEDPDELCRAANRLAPDLEAWLLARPAVVAQIRQRMNRGKKEVA